jgi:hypothetical protein
MEERWPFLVRPILFQRSNNLAQLAAIKDCLQQMANEYLFRLSFHKNGYSFHHASGFAS